VLGALKHARRRKATTVAVAANRDMPVARLAKILIAPEVGQKFDRFDTLKSGNRAKNGAEHALTAAMVRSDMLMKT